MKRRFDLPFLHAWDPSRYAEGYLRSGILEEEVQLQVLAQLRQLGCIAFPIDVGSKNLRGKAYGALAAAGRQDLYFRLAGNTGAGMKGISDVIGVSPTGRAIFIEVKKPALYVPEGKEGRLIVKDGGEAGTPTDDQLLFLANVHRSGAIAGVVWSSLDCFNVYRDQTREAA